MSDSEIGADLEEDLEFHPLFDKFKKYSVLDDDVRVIQYHKLADCLRLIGIILVIDGHIEKLLAKYCPKYIPKEQQKPPTNDEDCDDDEEDEEDEDAQEEVQEGGVIFEEFIQIYEEAEAASGTYTEDMLRDALRPLETSKVLDSGEIIHTITKEDISNFLTTFGDVLSDDDMKDFCAEFDGINSGKNSQNHISRPTNRQ